MAKIIKNFLIITIIFFLNFIALNIHGITMEEFEAEFHKKWLYGESSEEYKIHYAAMCGYNTIIDQLYAKSNECINAQDYVGRTPLQYAISSGKFEATHFLILSGANVNICDYNNTAPLALAITKYAFLKNCQKSRQSKHLGDISSLNKEIITYKQIIRILVKRGAGYWCRQDYYLKEVLLDALDIKEIEIPLIDGKKR